LIETITTDITPDDPAGLSIVVANKGLQDALDNTLIIEEMSGDSSREIYHHPINILSGEVIQLPVDWQPFSSGEYVIHASLEDSHGVSYATDERQIQVGPLKSNVLSLSSPLSRPEFMFLFLLALAGLISIVYYKSITLSGGDTL